ncbi:syntaxin-8-like [Patiria miniata]|uniref:t-SNARE coiled-coil homology domain-containing protein n=1 Tax=Patiria miniata TaxID=46514 RepID=A0A914AMD9_PATMI|nr:syntaxin-8-like [Patiria miniata]
MQKPVDYGMSRERLEMASFGTDPWLADYETCLRTGQSLMEKINQRDELQRKGSSHSKIEAEIRLALRKFSKSIEGLKGQLLKASSNYHLTQREVDRRVGLLDNLTAKDKILNDAFRKDITYTAPERTRLLAPNTAGFGQDYYDEPDEIRGMSINEIREQQQQVIQQQDEGLESLATVIARQKQMGQTIGTELEEHNEILDDLSRHVGKTDSTIVRETKHIRTVTQKAKDCSFYIIIILLLVAIVIIAVIPRPK